MYHTYRYFIRKHNQDIKRGNSQHQKHKCTKIQHQRLVLGAHESVTGTDGQTDRQTTVYISIKA